jgi:hypothetical protein
MGHICSILKASSAFYPIVFGMLTPLSFAVKVQPLELTQNAMKPTKKIYPAMTQPTGRVLVPVCVADLPAHNYTVSASDLTETVTSHLDAHPELPGVIVLYEEGGFGLLPRKRMYERLGHRYGVELFLRKPIRELCEILGVRSFNLHPHTRIDDAVYQALARPADELYDPIVVVSGTHKPQLLDFHTLLLAQSQILNNMNNLFSTVNRIEHSLGQSADLQDQLTFILDGLRQVVPYHHAAVLPKDAQGVHLSDREVLTFTPSTAMVQNAIYQAVLRHNQPIYLEDVNQAPDWRALGSFAELRTWVGIPLRKGETPLGILSLGRRTLSPFRRDEMSIAETFGGYISQALQRQTSA